MFFIACRMMPSQSLPSALAALRIARSKLVRCDYELNDFTFGLDFS
jgi:hypothetical protein